MNEIALDELIRSLIIPAVEKEYKIVTTLDMIKVIISDLDFSTFNDVPTKVTPELLGHRVMMHFKALQNDGLRRAELEAVEKERAAYYPASALPYEILAKELGFDDEKIIEILNRRRCRGHDTWQWHYNHFCTGYSENADRIHRQPQVMGRYEALATALLYREEERITLEKTRF